MAPATTLLATALAWQQAGASVIPVKPDGTKRPAVPWKRHQTVPATAAQVKAWWADETAGIGLICGAVSGGLEMLELEGRAVKENILTDLATAFADHDKADLWAKLTAGYLEASPSGGLHIIYRVNGKPKPNTKLARRPATDAEKADNPGAQVEVLIETRGEGGYTVVAPTPGTCHPSGRGWVAIAGTPDTVATITADERDAIHAIAATCDQMPSTPAPVARALPSPVAPGEGGRPGDAFNSAASWDDILTPAGWQRVRRDGPGWDWVRPGKKAADGISATTGTSTDGVDRFYVFTTSTQFDTEVPYSKFAAWAVLNTGGDMSEAARQLAAQGYGDQPTIDTAAPITFNGDTITPRTPADPAPDTDGSAALAPVVDIDQARAIRQAIGRGFTDRDNADLMTARHRDRLRYIPSRHVWMAWDGTRWAIADDNGPAIQAAIDTLDAITIPTDGTKAFTAWQRSYGRARLEAMTSLASTMPSLRVDADRLDA
ncbi:bifunctional DNA primase/polymerase, partial [Propionibacterium freudenreichii]|uniref:bifunctional DNA primase/polymerase n=1 Tax=Propionibacterium freudenreichii TaxID=1744 RepID=UPI00385270E9